MAVIDQSLLQISFALNDGNGNIAILTLPIRPEELTRNEPSRVAVNQTLDGAFVDSFGRGLTTLTISGHTGWGQGTRPQGADQFKMLRDYFIHAWHDLRTTRIKDGKDPNDVRLIFIDALNNKYVADVVPTQFTLRRSKSQPLLFLYNITLQVIAEKAKNPSPELLEAIDPNTKAATSVTSMTGSVGALTGNAIGRVTSGGGLLGTLNGLTAQIGALGNSALTATKNTFGPVMATAASIIATANAAKRALTATEQAVVDVARELSATATKVWDAAGAVAEIPAAAQASILQVKGEFSNLGCVLSNGFTSAIGTATTPSIPYGASNCSSTAGGSAPSTGTNPFVGSTTAGPVTTSPDAVAAINAINALDLTQPVDQAALTALINRVNAGITVAGATPTTAPTVSLVTPSSGPIAGGTSITIIGANLSGATGVTISGVACTALSGNTSTSLTCVTPAGTVSGKVVVTTAGGANASSPLFTYVTATPSPSEAVPWVASISPNVGPSTGMTTITMTGENLGNVIDVVFDSTVCMELNVDSETSITCVTPSNDMAGSVYQHESILGLIVKNSKQIGTQVATWNEFYSIEPTFTYVMGMPPEPTPPPAPPPPTWTYLAATSVSTHIGVGDTVSINITGGIPGETFVYKIYATDTIVSLQSGGSGIINSNGSGLVSILFDPIATWTEYQGMWVYLEFGSTNPMPTLGVSFKKKSDTVSYSYSIAGPATIKKGETNIYTITVDGLSAGDGLSFMFRKPVQGVDYLFAPQSQYTYHDRLTLQADHKCYMDVICLDDSTVAAGLTQISFDVWAIPFGIHLVGSPMTITITK